MTKERRRNRHKLQRLVLLHHFHDFKMVATPRQLKIAAKRVADMLWAGRNPLQTVLLDK